MPAAQPRMPACFNPRKRMTPIYLGAYSVAVIPSMGNSNDPEIKVCPFKMKIH
jgi:hypothetical protein